MNENEVLMDDISEADYYVDIDYDAIVNSDYGFRTDEIMDSTADEIARENNLNKELVREELDKADRRQKQRDFEALEMQRQFAKELNNEQNLTLENEQDELKRESSTQNLESQNKQEFRELDNAQNELNRESAQNLESQNVQERDYAEQQMQGQEFYNEAQEMQENYNELQQQGQESQQAQENYNELQQESRQMHDYNEMLQIQERETQEYYRQQQNKRKATLESQAMILEDSSLQHDLNANQDLALQQEFNESLDKEKAIKEAENSMQNNPNLTQAVNITLAFKETQQRINELDERRQETYTPKEKLEMHESAVNNVKSNIKIKEAVSISREIKETQAQIELLKSQMNNQNAQNSQKAESQNAQNTQKEPPTELPQESQEEQQQGRVKSEAELQSEIEKLEEKLENDRDNLSNVLMDFKTGDIAELLKSLYQLDRALEHLFNDSAKLAHKNNDKRQRELNKINSKNQMEYLKKNIFDLADKLTQAESNIKRMEEQRDLFRDINQAIDRGVEPKVMQEKLDNINKNYPIFKTDYPKTYQKMNNYINNPKQERQQAPQQQGRGR